MELRHLRYFVALAETLNFTRAAERVHVTQSTLSHQIKQLELEIAAQLFDRLGRRVTLTHSGEGFLPFAMRALTEVDLGLGMLKQDPAQLTGVVRVGATHTFNIEFIPICAADFVARHPTVKMVIEELAADVIDARLKSDSLDIGIAYRPAANSDLRFEPLYNEEMVLVVSDRHPLAARKRLRMIELHRQSLVLLPRGFATRQLLDECFSACDAQPLVVMEMNAIAPMLGLVLRTAVGAIVAKSAVPATRGLRIIPLESPTPVRTPGMLWKRDSSQTAPVRSFASIVRRTALHRSSVSRRKAKPAAN
jgi:LysR family cyn operon transcriptional activator